jgi:hypothetical protein
MGVPKRNGSGDRCVFSNVRSAILTAHYGTTLVSERSANSPDGCMKQRVCRRLSSKKGDGQKNRRLVAFFFRFLNRLNEKCGICAQECAQAVCLKRVASRRYKALLWLHLESKATA